MHEDHGAPDTESTDTSSIGPSTERTHVCYAMTYDPTQRIYSDQTGCFVIPSSTGNAYIMCVYDVDSNFIFVEAFRTRTTASENDDGYSYHWLLVVVSPTKSSC